jgi:diguanylate cyclase (GGDEF)-like protein
VSSGTFVDTVVMRDATRRPPWSLAFPPELEQEYLSSTAEARRQWVRLSVFVALSTTLGFAIIDHWVLARPTSPVADSVRFGLQLPLVLFALALTTKRWFERAYLPVITLAAPLFGIGTVVMAAAAPPDQTALVTLRILLAAFFFYFMMGLGWVRALGVNAVMAAAFAGVSIAGMIEPRTATYSLFVIFCANLIGSAGAYALERANRSTFLEKRRLAETATRDGLTGLLNRAAFDERMHALHEQAARDGVPLAVVLIDIDHFKAFNDQYGHPAGDQCLRMIASTVRHAARRRPLDLVGRYGGEELVAVLYGGTHEHAENVARGIVAAVGRLQMPHVASTTCGYVTVSVGAATASPSEGAPIEALVERADGALYAAKSAGRNRHVVAASVASLDAARSRTAS